MSMHLRGSRDMMGRDESWWQSRTGLEQKLVILSTVLFILSFSLTITVIVLKNRSPPAPAVTTVSPVTDTSTVSGEPSPVTGESTVSASTASEPASSSVSTSSEPASSSVSTVSEPASSSESTVSGSTGPSESTVSESVGSTESIVSESPSPSTEKPKIFAPGAGSIVIDVLDRNP